MCIRDSSIPGKLGYVLRILKPHLAINMFAWSLDSLISSQESCRFNSMSFPHFSLLCPTRHPACPTEESEIWNNEMIVTKLQWGKVWGNRYMVYQWDKSLSNHLIKTFYFGLLNLWRPLGREHHSSKAITITTGRYDETCASDIHTITWASD